MAETLIGIKPLQTRILVGIYDDGDKTTTLGGKKFYLLDDSSADKARDVHTKHQGIRPRWGIVLSVSDIVAKNGDVSVGDKVLMDEMKWTRGFQAPINGGEHHRIWSIPIEDVLLVGGSEEFTAEDKDQITRLYPDWKDWSVNEL